MRFKRSQFTVKSIGIMGYRQLIVFIRDTAMSNVISYEKSVHKMLPELSHHLMHAQACLACDQAVQCWLKQRQLKVHTKMENIIKTIPY